MRSRGTRGGVSAAVVASGCMLVASCSPFDGSTTEPAPEPAPASPPPSNGASSGTQGDPAADAGTQNALGFDGFGPTEDKISADVACVFRSAATATTLVAHVSFLYAGSSSSNPGVTSLALGIYADNAEGTRATTLLGAATTEVRAEQRGQWVTATLASPVALESGKSYWLAVLPKGSGDLLVRDHFGQPGATAANCAGNVSTLPATWTTGKNYAQAPLSEYASP